MADVKPTEKETKAWVNGVAGPVGSVVSKTLMSPIQRVVVLKQLDQRAVGTPPKSIAAYVDDIVNETRRAGLAADAKSPSFHPSHLRGFFRGNLASILQRIPYSGIQLVAYDRTKHFLAENYFMLQAGDTTSPSAVSCKMAASGFAAGVSGAAVYPLEVVRSRLMSKDTRCERFGETIRVIYSDRGVRGFYAGLLPSLVQRVPDIMINYTVFESVRHTMGGNGYGDVAAVWAGGSAAALTSIACTFPIDVVKRRMAAGDSLTVKYTGVMHCVTHTLKTEGFGAFYKGAALDAARSMPQVVLMWYLIESTRKILSAY